MRRWKRKEKNREIWNDVDENRCGEEEAEEEEEEEEEAGLSLCLEGRDEKRSNLLASDESQLRSIKWDLF